MIWLFIYLAAAIVSWIFIQGYCFGYFNHFFPEENNRQFAVLMATIGAILHPVGFICTYIASEKLKYGWLPVWRS
jgi:hypothetical protein